MGVLNRHLLSMGRWLARNRQPLAIVLASLFSVALLAARVAVSRQGLFVFLVWNLWLAWLPFLFALWAQRLDCHYPRRWLYLLVPGVLWLIFFPNAPYIVTDLFHLRERPPIPLWYDLGLLSAFSLTGLFLAVFSLHVMHRVVRKYVGWLVSWLFVGVVLCLGGLGIYLGRFLRWNSWDLLLRPDQIVTDLVVRLASPLSYPRTYGVTLLYAALLFVCYLAIAPREPMGREPSHSVPLADDV